MAEDWLPKVESALARSGVPLEMYVAQQFRRGGFDVAQAEFYEDPISEQQREIDIVATRSEKIGDDSVRLVFAVECKASRDKPWVMFVGHPRMRPERQWRWQLAMGGVGNHRGSRLRFELSAGVRDLPVFSDGRSPAYGMVQLVLGSEKDDPERKDQSYAATMQASKAAVALTKQIDSGIKSGLWGVLTNSTASIGFPLVVLDGRLVTARLGDDDDSVILEETGRHALMVRNPDIGATSSQLFVVTREALPELVSGLATACQYVFEWAKANPKVMDKVFERTK